MRNCPDCKENEKENGFNDGDTKIVKENSNITYVLSVIINKLGDKWILNSKYSYYIFPNKDWFSTYQQIDGGKALLVNSVACKVVRVNIIWIKMHDDIVRTLTDVRHVLELKKILIFLGIIDSNGCT